MPTYTLQKNYHFVLNLGSEVYNLGSDTLKLAFCTAANAPTTATDAYTDLTVVALTNILTSPSLTSVTWTETTGTATLAAASWTGVSQTGDFTFRYVVVYDDSSASKNIIGWYDYGSDLTLHGANADQIVLDLTAHILTLA